MSTKYPYCALARNYIVQTALTRRPPRLPCCPLATTSYWTVAHAYSFPIGRPLQYTGLLLATHFSKDLPLSHPHSADISAFFHALRRQYCVVVIRHVSVEREFVSFAITRHQPSSCPHSGTYHPNVTSCRRIDVTSAN